MCPYRVSMFDCLSNQDVALLNVPVDTSWNYQILVSLLLELGYASEASNRSLTRKPGDRILELSPLVLILYWYVMTSAFLAQWWVLCASDAPREDVCTYGL
ncbi:hypothetical protein BJ508DRAFT_304715 [Ascobolus immersus RN42]|uniref:Uncharacterized protein n=1 Tax=Ascobolus immersus RN42 TaxID=1160509 RepID=A0A3N4IDI1_ASCIM|nr:hypothetical protein BJ508DRAFT_304715 [Ascobolus immersus RN42]